MVITENARHPLVPMAIKNSAFLLTAMVQLDEQSSKKQGYEARGALNVCGQTCISWSVGARVETAFEKRENAPL